jgi:hypothetical protein
MIVIACIECVPFLVTAKGIVSKGKGVYVSNGLTKTICTRITKGISAKGVTIVPAHGFPTLL